MEISVRSNILVGPRWLLVSLPMSNQCHVPDDGRPPCRVLSAQNRFLGNGFLVHRLTRSTVLVLTRVLIQLVRLSLSYHAPSGSITVVAVASRLRRTNCVSYWH
jgi:hypothetical protein